MLRVTGLLSLLLMFSSFAFAESTYLDCQVSSKTEKKKFSLRFDESSGKVTHTGENGNAFNAEGFFAANSISYQNISLIGSIKVTFRYEINRTNLTVTEVFVAEPADSKYTKEVPGSTSTMSGSCGIVKPSARKI